MNELQVLKQIRYRLRQQNWSEGAAETVFADDSVRISVNVERQALKVMRTPIALLRPLDVQSDPAHDEEPDLLTAQIAVRLVTALPGDSVGEAALMGANRTAGFGSSKGRGLFEVEEELFNAIEVLNAKDGVEIQMRAKGAAAAVLDEELGYVAYRDYQFEAVVTADRFYHPASRLVATTPGGGQVTLAWALPPDRFDRLRVILRRAAGATPPATSSSGTGVTLSGNLATGVTDTPGAGQFSYALFAAYDDEPPAAGPAVERHYSTAVTKTVTAV